MLNNISKLIFLTECLGPFIFRETTPEILRIINQALKVIFKQYTGKYFQSINLLTIILISLKNE